MKLEHDLRDALRPVDPGDAFAAGVQARLAAQRGGAAAPVGRPHVRRRWLLPTALAASVLLAIGVALRVEQQRERQRELYASAQLAQALEFTSSRLDAVQRRIEHQIAEK